MKQLIQELNFSLYFLHLLVSDFLLFPLFLGFYLWQELYLLFWPEQCLSLDANHLFLFFRLLKLTWAFLFWHILKTLLLQNIRKILIPQNVLRRLKWERNLMMKQRRVRFRRCHSWQLLRCTIVGWHYVMSRWKHLVKLKCRFIQLYLYLLYSRLSPLKYLILSFLLATLFNFSYFLLLRFIFLFLCFFNFILGVSLCLNFLLDRSNMFGWYGSDVLF